MKYLEIRKLIKYYNNLDEHFLRLEKENIERELTGKLYKNHFEEKILAIPGELNAKLIDKNDMPELINHTYERTKVEVFKLTNFIFNDSDIINLLIRLYIINQKLTTNEDL